MYCENCKSKTATSIVTSSTSGLELFVCEDCKDIMLKENSNSSGNIKFCKNCGTTLNDFFASGKVGCKNCYSDFYDNIKSRMQSFMFFGKHSGKVCNIYQTKKELKALELELEKAITQGDLAMVNKLNAKIKSKRVECL